MTRSPRLQLVFGDPRPVRCRHHELHQFDPRALGPPSLGRGQAQIRDMGYQRSVGPSVNDDMTAHGPTPSLAPPYSVASPFLFAAASESGALQSETKLLHDLCDFSVTCINPPHFLIENIFGKIKEFKRIALRAGKTDQSFEAMICLAASLTNSR
jgi:hypothetical protein